MDLKKKLCGPTHLKGCPLNPGDPQDTFGMMLKMLGHPMGKQHQNKKEEQSCLDWTQRFANLLEHNTCFLPLPHPQSGSIAYFLEAWSWISHSNFLEPSPSQQYNVDNTHFTGLLRKLNNRHLTWYLGHRKSLVSAVRAWPFGFRSQLHREELFDLDQVLLALLKCSCLWNKENTCTRLITLTWGYNKGTRVNCGPLA